MVVKSITGEQLAMVQAFPAMTVEDLKEKVAKATSGNPADQKLVVGNAVLTGGTLAEACHGALKASEGMLEVILVHIPRHTFTQQTKTVQSHAANDGARVFHPKPDCPTQGDYGIDSEHYWSNHSSGGTFLRVELPQTNLQIVEVHAKVVAHDQGWGGTGEAGAVVVLLNRDRQELAYTAISLDGHDHATLEWHITPESHCGHFPIKKGEEAYGTICGEGEGLIVELRLFTPDYGGWSVTGLEGLLSVTCVG